MNDVDTLCKLFDKQVSLTLTYEISTDDSNYVDKDKDELINLLTDLAKLDEKSEKWFKIYDTLTQKYQMKEICENWMKNHKFDFTTETNILSLIKQIENTPNRLQYKEYKSKQHNSDNDNIAKSEEDTKFEEKKDNKDNNNNTKNTKNKNNNAFGMQFNSFSDFKGFDTPTSGFGDFNNFTNLNFGDNSNTTNNNNNNNNTSIFDFGSGKEFKWDDVSSGFNYGGPNFGVNENKDSNENGNGNGNGNDNGNDNVVHFDTNAFFDQTEATGGVGAILSDTKNEKKEEQKVSKKLRHIASDRDNGADCSKIKAIVSLNKCFVSTGHENELLICSIPIKKLSIFQDNAWKTRATNTLLNFYCKHEKNTNDKNKNKNKNLKNNSNNIRIVVREEQTQKLRINHYGMSFYCFVLFCSVLFFVCLTFICYFFVCLFVCFIVGHTVSKGCELKKLSERQWCWFAYDGTIGDFGGYLFAVKFRQEADCQSFRKQFKQAAA